MPLELEPLLASFHKTAVLSRFILNLPEDELAEVERVCFQVEQA